MPPYDSSNKLRVQAPVLGLQVTFSRTWNAVGSRLSPRLDVKRADPAINGLGAHGTFHLTQSAARCSASL